MKKWYWIVGAVIIGLIAWHYLTQEEKSVVAEIDAENWEPKARGDASSIDDLPLECQAKYVGWARWMESVKTTNAWPKALINRAANNGTTFEAELEIEFVNKYNSNAATGQCDE